MKKIFWFVVFCAFSTFAQQKLSPVIADMETLYPKNKSVLLKCLDNVPSSDKSLGCVESFKYLKSLCQVVHEPRADFRYNRLQLQILYGACKASALGDNRLPLFFDLDARGCVKGYETLNERLISYNKNKELIDEAMEEKFLYMYEKNSCKDFRTYVNFCNYVDGPNKTMLPDSHELLPQVDYSKAPGELCKPAAALSEGLYTINYDLSTLIKEQKTNAYNTLILNYRSRMPAGKAFSACEQVRSSYDNIGCAKFEKIMDGEPAWRTEEQMKEIRMRQDAASRADRAERAARGDNAN